MRPTSWSVVVRIQLCIPSEPEYVGIVRLTVAGIAHRLGLNLEQSDDLKLAVTEACGFLLEHTSNGEPINLDFNWNETRFQITVEVGGDLGQRDDLSIEGEDSLGLFLIHALMDEVQAKNQGRTLILSKDLSRRVDE